MKKLLLLCTSFIVIGTLQAQYQDGTITEALRRTAERIREIGHPETRPAQTGPEATSSTSGRHGGGQRGESTAGYDWEKAKDDARQAWEKAKTWFSETFGGTRPGAPTTPPQKPGTPASPSH